MVEEDVRQRGPESGERTDQTGSGEGVPPNLNLLPLVERAGLVQDVAVQVELPDVVELAAESKGREARAAPAEAARDHLREQAHTGGVTLRVGVPRLDRLRQRGQHHAWLFQERA